MSCYLRGMKEILAEAGIEVTPQNRKKVDQAIHKILGMEDEHCPQVWKTIKERVLNDEQEKKEFTRKLKEALIQ